MKNRDVDKTILDEEAILGMVHTLPILPYEVVVGDAVLFGKNDDFVLRPGEVAVTDIKVVGVNISVALKFVDSGEGAADEDMVLVLCTDDPVVTVPSKSVKNC